jgi:hypothetical protein
LPRHTITLRPADREGSYRVTGAVEIADSDRPIYEAAAALKAAGADEHDMVVVAGSCATFLPTSIYALLKWRPHPPKAISALTNGRGPTNP